MLLHGGCHCGKLRIEFETALVPADTAPRACDCSFCMKHGASYVSDPKGRLAIAASGTDTIAEYRQGSQSARLLLCRHCGVLVAAVFEQGAELYGTVNSRCLDDAAAFAAPLWVSPQQLSTEDKRKRWAKLWTPGVRLTVR